MSSTELKQYVLKKPKPTIFLRNEFSVRPGLEGQFFEGQRELVRNAFPRMQLVAAFGAAPVRPDLPAPFPPVQMFHIWSLHTPGKDPPPAWGVLYDIMIDFSETEWYVRELSSLRGEHQDLVVSAAPGISRTPRPATWRNAHEPGYAYVYELVRLRGKTTRQFLKDLNWLTAQAKLRGCELMWLTQEVTGTPSQIAVLWRVPDFARFDEFLRDMTYGPQVAERYAKSMLGLEYFSRDYMYPESTEHIDNNLRSPG